MPSHIRYKRLFVHNSRMHYSSKSRTQACNLLFGREESKKEEEVEGSISEDHESFLKAKAWIDCIA